MGTTISRWGNSLAVRIPKAVLDATELHEGDEVLIGSEGGRIVIRPAVAVDLEAMLAGVTRDNVPDKTLDWAPVGRELL